MEHTPSFNNEIDRAYQRTLLTPAEERAIRESERAALIVLKSEMVLMVRQIDEGSISADEAEERLVLITDRLASRESKQDVLDRLVRDDSAEDR